MEMDFLFTHRKDIMGIFDIFKKEEQRSNALTLEAFLSSAEITKEMALEVPTFSGGIDLIANIIASTPIKLYKCSSHKAKEVEKDYRLKLLNDETGDILTSNEFWRAIIRDYYVGGGGYAYINKELGEVKSLHYIDEACISVNEGVDPIFKSGNIVVNGISYHEFEFIKILRNTKNGLSGRSLIAENQKLLSVGYYGLKLESNNFKRGGIKKGFLKAENRLDEASVSTLKSAFNKLYTSDNDTFVLLNKGVDFKESSATQVEMQLNQSKNANTVEFAKLFHISPDVISGKSTDTKALAKLAAIPLMKIIESALNKTMLLEKEKEEYYFAFDTKELLKGEINERFSAYKTALDANFMQIDEVRYAEDLDPLGLTWIKLGLKDVLYDPKSRTVYTPNTNKTSSMQESEVSFEGKALTKEYRARFNAERDAGGRFARSRFKSPEDMGNSFEDLGEFKGGGASSSSPKKKGTITDVTDEYLRNAKPGVGKVEIEDGVDKKLNKNEIETANWLKDKFGGDIKVLKDVNKDKIKTSDYEWNGKLWELKNVSSDNSIDKQM